LLWQLSSDEYSAFLQYPSLLEAEEGLTSKTNTFSDESLSIPGYPVRRSPVNKNPVF
jgi:hypothetical protein